MKQQNPTTGMSDVEIMIQLRQTADNDIIDYVVKHPEEFTFIATAILRSAPNYNPRVVTAFMSETP